MITLIVILLITILITDNSTLMINVIVIIDNNDIVLSVIITRLVMTMTVMWKIIGNGNKDDMINDGKLW